MVKSNLTKQEGIRFINANIVDYEVSKSLTETIQMHAICSQMVLLGQNAIYGGLFARLG